MNKYALITGGSKRLGKAFTGHLAEKGWNIIIHYNTSVSEAAKLVKKLIKSYPLQKFSALQSDLSVTGEAETLIYKVVSEFGKIDLLINNASVFEPAHIVNTTADLFDNHFNIHMRTPFFLIRDFAKYCKEGNIINIIDTRISSNKSNYAAYSLSKKGLWNLTKMAAFELAPEIRVNAIAPGLILPPEGKDMNYLRELAENIPLKRPGDIGTLLKSMDFILENDYLTGQIIYADGGQNIGCIN